MRLKEWPVGEEPEITFPKVDGVLHEFVDILFKTKKQHEVGREPRPPLRAVCDPLIPWLHAAFVDEKEYFVVQGTNPHLTPNEKTGEYSDKQIEEMKMWGVNFMCSFVRSENFCTIGKPICVWYLPYGFPHSPDFVLQQEHTRKDQSISFYYVDMRILQTSKSIQRHSRPTSK